ncbi:HEAT repeat domain-containing protein [Undibacterium sp. Di24W]|uniref:HEAT repeat domain-containing protein n=1 Tax=Undibacterium sp. Di24W TaxID=3413033 RepID=UPI003BF32FC9
MQTGSLNALFGSTYSITLLDSINALGKISLILIVVLLVLACLQKLSAAKRALAAYLTLAGLFFAPISLVFDWKILPTLAVNAPLAWSAVSDAALNLPNLPKLGYIAAHQQLTDSEPNSSQMFIATYVLIALLFISKLIFDLWRLANLQQKLKLSLSSKPTKKENEEKYQRWHTRLESLLQQYKINRPVDLYFSAQVTAPISWGLSRPCIIVDLKSYEYQEPDDILRHELAHIANRDWLTLMLARLITALYWFHPLIWTMQKQLRFNMECAADDTVIRMGGRPSHYAEMLVQVSQAANAKSQAKHDAATALAARGKTLYQRILAILDPHKSRQPVSSLDWTFTSLITLVLIVVTSSISLVGEQTRWPQELFVDTKSNGSSHGDAGKRAAIALEALNNPNFNALANALRSGDFAVRHASDVASFKQRRAIAPLILALHDDDANVRRLALWGLSEMRFYETIPVIALMLKDPNHLVRAEAARAIGDCGERDWSTQLLPLLSDTSPYVRQQVAHALGDLADPRSLPALQAHLQDSDPDVVSKIKWAIQEIRN